MPAGTKKFQGLQQNFRIFGRGGLMWRPPPYYPREGSRQDLPAGIPRLSKRISCLLTVKHTIPATGDEKFPRTTTKLQRISSGRLFSGLLPYYPREGSRPDVPVGIPRLSVRVCCRYWKLFVPVAWIVPLIARNHEILQKIFGRAPIF